MKTRQLSLWISRPWLCVCAFVSQNPDIVLVHYLNVPALEDCGKGCSPIFCSISSDRREWLKWSREELLGQLKPMCKEQGRDRAPERRVDRGPPKGGVVLCGKASGGSSPHAGGRFPVGSLASRGKIGI